MSKVIARIPFKYMGNELERGEVVELRGSARDEQLRGLGYFIAYDKNEHGEMVCDNCSKRFASDGFRLAHKKKLGGCLAPSSPISRAETAELLGVEEKKVKIED